MAELLDMLGMLTTVRKPGHVVGYRYGKSIQHEEFLARVGAWRELLRRTSGQRFALYLNDSVEFASALFGAWAAGKVIYLPGDTLPSTCANLRQIVHGYLGEFASQWDPMIPTPQDEEDHGDDRDWLNGDFVGLVLFTSGSTGAPEAIPKKLSQMSREVATLETLFGDPLSTAEVITTVSHQHIYGLLFNVLWPLVAGRAIHARNFLFPQELTAVLADRDGLLVSSPAHLKRLPEQPVGRRSRTDCERCFRPADLYRSTLPVTRNDYWVLCRLKSMEAPRLVELRGVSSIPEWMKHGPPCRVLLVVSILKKAYWKFDRPICRTITGFARQIVPYPWETIVS